MEVTRAQSKIEVWESGLSTDKKAALVAWRSKRRQARTKITKGATKLLSEVADSRKAKVVQSREDLKILKSDLQKIDDEIWSLMEDESVMEADMLIGDEWYEKASEAFADADDFLDQLASPAAAVVSSTDPVASTLARLPKVDLQKFTGKSPGEYQTFINSFNTLIHSRTDLAKVQKLIYLKFACIEDAAELAEGYSLTDDNYDNFRKTLETMFGHPRLVQQSHVDNILNLKPFETHSIMPFLSTLETSLRCLAEYKADMEECAYFIVPHIEKLMPKEIKQKWKEEIYDDQSFSTKKLLAFLHAKLQCYGQNEKGDGKNKDVRPKTTSMLSTASKEYQCYYCEKSHKIFACDEFKKLSPKERSNFIFKKKFCNRCLSPFNQKHTPQTCRSGMCKVCNKPHNTLLHWGSSPKGQQGNQQEAKSSTSSSVSSPVTSSQEGSSKPVSESASFVITSKSSSTEKISANALHHAPVKKEKLTVLKNFQAVPRGRPDVVVRSAIDDGSQKTWILAKTARKLKLPVLRRTLLAVATAFSDEYNAPRLYDVVKISLRTKDGRFCEMEAIVSQSDKLTVDMEAINFDPVETYPHLADICFADVYPRDASEVELLIGNDFADNIETGRRRIGKFGEPSAIETLFGWCLSGRIDQEVPLLTSTNLSPVVELENTLEKFWRLEEVPNPKSRIKSLIDEKVHQEFLEKIEYDEANQQYKVEIPYKPEVKDLENNYAPAKMLYLKQQEKLKKDPEKRNTVHKIFDDQIDQGVLELISETDTPKGGVHYLPWHLVERPGHPTTPTRIVKNASFRGRNGISLNSAQHIGPNLLPDIVASTIRFRKGRIGFITDVSKMFWQVKIPPEQQDLHQIITHKGIARQCTVMFGESSSPFLSMATCHYHASREDIKQKFPEACRYVMMALYMDDIPDCVDDLENGVEVLTQLRGFFSSMHMKMHKINSNNKELLAKIEGTDDKEEAVVLGLNWNTIDDTLHVPIKTWDRTPSTKREFLQQIAAFWDPIGGRSPLICKGKMLMQKIWQSGSNWDDPLSDNLKKEVEDFRKAICVGFSVSRFFGSPKVLHVFCDASEGASACVGYVISPNGSFFLLSKTRVKPIKVVSLPRMELLGAVLGARLLDFLKEEVFTSKIESFMWTDSTIALGWIESPSARYKPFVGNRIAEIQRTSSKHSATWLWVPGTLNPADLPSRGIWPLNPGQSKLWAEGPEFLKSGDWPIQPKAEMPDLELRKVAVCAVSVHEPLIQLDRFSSFEKLLRIMIYVLQPGLLWLNKEQVIQVSHMVSGPQCPAWTDQVK